MKMLETENILSKTANYFCFQVRLKDLEYNAEYSAKRYLKVFNKYQKAFLTKG